MADPELMSIGAFAKLAGLTASALRFYDDAGLLHPEQVDPLTGYRLYSESQLVRASQLRQLREVGMPLPTIGRFFSAGTHEAAQLIDDQVARVAAEAAGIQRAAATLKASLGEAARISICTLSGPVLAAVIDQIVATTSHDSAIPVLNGVRLEVNPDVISLTATDRYRLATRTLVPSQPSAASWVGTLAGDDLQAAASRLRRTPIVRLEVGERILGLRMADSTVAHCRLLTEIFPDYKLLVSSLPPVSHRVTVEKRDLLKALEQQAPEKIGLRVEAGRPSLLLPDGAVELNGTASGPDLTLWFELTTLYPAVSHALGNDLMLDLRGPDQPATVRSADDGDFTTLVMPCLNPAS
ncbi:DNA polymerase-3 subunit beta [Mycobacterium frederiksbergense]|uniref:DNA polymerase-3 subunit beta n=1 Tax=Mycolicibacterium frederiksbergense TaxID=117567 RepID=A0ABT6KUE7_9MYCO|nr:MerR family transcriptional regulator [Mycolicibacterium frederiksbergense]MDH6194223.1 DNA polymerase-3 subunit beta [Mycolicibacterium frederiksbergense]